MTAATLTPALREWITRQTRAGQPPDPLLGELLAAGWSEDQKLIDSDSEYLVPTS